MELRHVEQDDIKWMWECRNDVDSRNNSLQTEEITLTEHILWVNQSMCMTNRKLMIAWNEGRKIAVVRLDRDNNKAMVSINVAEENRGKGNALKILRELEGAALEWSGGIRFLQAIIKKENKASIKVFIKAGFEQYGIDGQLVIMQKQITSEEGEEMERSRTSLNIAGREIGQGCRPFIIAEMSGNHNQSLVRALEIVEQAAAAGVDALKLQTYTADTMTLDVSDGDFYINDDKSLWAGRSLFSLYNEAYTPWEWHEPIFKRCKELGLIVFSTPFDSTAVDFLESLEVPAYKIASFENTDIPLIRKVAQTGKPIIISTGMANLTELEEAVRAVRETGNSKLILLKCTSTYPASPENTNISTIPHMRELFDCEVGLSDHTMGVGVSVASVAFGASVIEKHFTLSRADGGVDSSFSLEPDEMRSLVIETERAWQSLGSISYGPTDKEKPSMQFRRSLYVSEDMKKGESFTENNIRIVRPGYGLPPKYFDFIIGKQVKLDVKKGTPINWDII